ncbi:MAG: hypothetical protein MUD14_28560 [Hydrococcus sp. Prado102]|jgi:uncharacterized coiled-coil DUF342 family protein|nr:hypothetical protein [Hydrococcus sp. Prado102]
MAVERWTDEMLDELASSVGELRESVGELRESVGELRESVGELRGGMGDLQETVGDLRDGVDGIRITAQALLQVAAQSQRDMELIKQRQAENDERFNVLLEEVRFLIRRNDREE